MTDGAGFRAAHATAPAWRDAVAAILLELGELTATHQLGFVYVTDSYADAMDEIAIFLRQTTGVRHWVGTVGLGVVGMGKEYFDEPAMSVLVAPLNESAFRLFTVSDDDIDAVRKENSDWLAKADTPLAVVHADPRIADITQKIEGLASATNGFLAGGLTASRGRFAQLAGDVDEGVLSGVMLSLHEVPVQLGLTQGCSPIGPTRTVTGAEENILFSIDGRPALDVLKEDIGEVLSRDLKRIGGYIFAALPVPGSDMADYLVRNLVGIDQEAGAVAIGEAVATGDTVMFCRRDPDSAVEDLKRMAGDLKRRAGGGEIKGGLYYSCVARGPNQFGPDSQELGIIRETLGDFPLAGLFANGEISNDRLYGYTGVLALFL
ncbi:MAG: histidine kinase [Alphaproteobacteria bacterium]|nr:histidine kinase [Alphaproteobacteria bacterium]